MPQLMLFYFYSFLIALYMINIFMDSQGLGYFVGILCILNLVLSYRGSNRLYQLVAFFFVVIGITLLLMTGGSLFEVPCYMGSTLTLLALFYVLPFINSVIVAGGYDQSISKLLKTKLDNLSQLYHRGLTVSLLLTSFLMISMIVLIISVREWLEFSYLTAVTLVIIPYSMLWASYQATLMSK